MAVSYQHSAAWNAHGVPIRSLRIARHLLGHRTAATRDECNWWRMGGLGTVT
jgi:hypothetical protein